MGRSRVWMDRIRHAQREAHEGRRTQLEALGTTPQAEDRKEMALVLVGAAFIIPTFVIRPELGWIGVVVVGYATIGREAWNWYRYRKLLIAKGERSG